MKKPQKSLKKRKSRASRTGRVRRQEGRLKRKLWEDVKKSFQTEDDKLKRIFVSDTKGEEVKMTLPYMEEEEVKMTLPYMEGTMVGEEISLENQGVPTKSGDTTFRGFILNYLVSNGMFDSQAEAVFQECVKGMPEMAGRWNEAIKNYPGTIKSIILFSVNLYASNWIRENKPQAWYRPMFDEEYRKQVCLAPNHFGLKC